MGVILFCGDTHGRHQHMLEVAERLEPMAVVLLGDIEFTRPAHVELAPIADRVWWIVGNHDTDRTESWLNLVESDLAERRLDGRVVTLPDGTRIAGLGGVFRGKMWSPPATPVHQSYEAWLETLLSGWRKRETMFAAERLKHQSSIFPETVERLAGQRADVLVTHEAPSVHHYGWQAIDELARRMGATELHHGHQHDSLPYEGHWERLGFRCWGVGCAASRRAEAP